VIDFLRQGAIATDHPDFVGPLREPCLSTLSSLSDSKAGSSEYSHGLKLEAAHFCTPNDGDDMRFTNYTPDFSGVIDHLFATPETLVCTGVLNSVDNQWMKESGAIVGFP